MAIPEQPERESPLLVFVLKRKEESRAFQTSTWLLLILLQIGQLFR